MNDEKRIKTELLLDSIGEIDDVLLADAISYRPKKRMGNRLVALAAAIAVVFTMTVSIALVLRIADMNKLDGAAPENEGENTTLDYFMSTLDEGGFEQVKSEDELPYLDGEAYVVWSYSGEEVYYLSDPLTETELADIKRKIGRGESVDGESPELDCMVWVLLGDGRVISPYLKPSAGNISSEVFDYEAEITPDEGLIAQIQGILS